MGYISTRPHTWTPECQHYDLVPSPISWWRQDSWFLSSNLVMGSGVQPLATENAVQGPATSPIMGQAMQKSQAPLQTSWIRSCIFWRKSGAIAKPGNCLLSDTCQNTSSAYCCDLARQERLVSRVLVEWCSDWTPSCRENTYCLGDRVTWEHQDFEQQLRISAKTFCSISWFPGVTLLGNIRPQLTCYTHTKKILTVHLEIYGWSYSYWWKSLCAVGQGLANHTL